MQCPRQSALCDLLRIPLRVLRVRLTSRRSRWNGGMLLLEFCAALRTTYLLHTIIEGLLTPDLVRYKGDSLEASIFAYQLISRLAVSTRAERRAWRLPLRLSDATEGHTSTVGRNLSCHILYRMSQTRRNLHHYHHHPPCSRLLYSQSL